MADSARHEAPLDQAQTSNSRAAIARIAKPPGIQKKLCIAK